MDTKKISLACIIYHDPAWPFDQLLAAISCLAKSESCKSIFCPGYFDGLSEARILQAASGKKIRFMSISARAGWAEAFNKLLASSLLREDYLLFFSSAVTPLNNCVDRMFIALIQNENFAGIVPVFLNPDQKSVFNLGLVVDSGGFLHFLYPGLPCDSALAQKERNFQIADFSLLCVRKVDARKAGGLNPQHEGMMGLSFSASIARTAEKPFLAVPQARAIMGNGMQSGDNCWLWNSFMLRNKIPLDLLKPDFAQTVVADELEYGIDEWLNEGPTGLPLHESQINNKFIGYLRNPCPESLLAWLAALPEQELPVQIEKVRGLPWCLPSNFHWYEEIAKRQAKFAETASLHLMLAQTQTWLKNSRRFHYGKLRSGMRILQKSGIYNSCLDFCPSIYDAWLELKPETEAPRLEVGASWPRIAIVMPVWNPQPEFLREALESVLAQSNPNWEMRIADDCSTRNGIREMLEAFAREDERIKVIFRSENGHISNATNSALSMVDAPWAAFMDHDDMLAKNAIAFVAQEIAQKPKLKFIYSDEDHIDIYNVRRSPIFRPGFDYALMFTGHLSCFRMDILRHLHFLRPGLEGYQDSDLALRISEIIRQEETAHISEILYHWRVHPDSTSMGLQAKPYVFNANIRAIEDELYRKGVKGRAIKRFSHIYQKEFAAESLSDCAVIVLQDSTINPELGTLLQTLEATYNLPVYRQPFGDDASQLSEFPAWRNLPFCKGGWAMATGQVIANVKAKFLLFLYGGLQPLAECALVQLPLAAKFWQTGVCAATLWKNGKLWNGGLFPDMSGKPFPLLQGMDMATVAQASWGWLDLPHRAIGVSWQAMLLDRDCFIECGGLKPEFGKFTMADYCLRLEQLGKFTIVSPLVNFGIAETRENEDCNTENAFLQAWGEKVAVHPLRNANLTAGATNDWTLVF